MLGTLCTLITALTCVSGVTVVTQKPPVVTLRKGETATMDCNLGTVTDSGARWYKQIPGGVPQYVIFFYHGDSSPFYGSGFSSSKFTSTHQSKSDYRLIINNVEEGDSAVYYCKTWDSSAKENVFGQGTKLIVTSSSLPPPVLTVFPPSSAELQSNKASLVCLSSQSVPFADVSWLLGGSPVSSGISTSTAVQQADQTFQISSYLAVQTSDWNMDKVYTCKVSLGSQTAEKNINKSHCPTEEQ
ncbi:immunoglobulin lambda-1 light chain-like isoform X3 [Epinephelus lanceolatus]